MIKMFIKLKNIKRLDYNKEYLFREAFPNYNFYFFDSILAEIKLNFKKWAVVEFKEKEFAKGYKQTVWVVRRIRKTFLEKILDK